MKWCRQIKCWVAGVLVMGAWVAVAEFRFDVWTAESGLPQNTVRGIVQTHDGYLWVATLDGLARFDGVRFKVFNKGTTPGLPANRVLALYEDSQSDLWIGLGEKGLARYRQDRFTIFGPQEGLPSASSISGDARGDLWVTALGDTPWHWNKDRFEPGLPASAAGFAREVVRGHRPGILWVANSDNVQIFSRGTLTTFNASNGLPAATVTQIDEDQYGTWWAATEGGLVKIRDGKVVRVYTTRDGLPRNSLNATSGSLSPAVACEDRKGNLWVNGVGPWLGRLKDGIFTAYPSTNTISSHPLPSAAGLPGTYINTLFEDREGNVWIGTEGSGLIRAREQVVNVLSTREGLQAVNVYPVLEDRTGAVWLGIWELGLVRVTAGVVTNFALRYPYGNVTSLCQDRAGHLWVGTMGGVVRFQDDKLSLADVPPEFNNLPVNAICQDRKGVLWFGSERGLFRYDKGELSHFTQKDGLAAGNIIAIIEDRSGALWIGTRAGLSRLASGQFTTWTERDGLPSNVVPALYEDADGTLWIGTADGGLGRYKDGRFIRYTTKDGLFDNGVFAILEDAQGNFWMSSNRGIHRVNKRELNEFAEGRRRTITSVAYGKSDGMLNAECNGACWPTGAKTRDGRLWFPTQNGVAVIDPGALSINPKPPQVVIEAFMVDRQSQSLQAPLRVPPRKGNIEIQYTGLSLVNSDRIAFKYRLAGADDEWVEAGTRRVANYSHLAPRHYVFTVLAANSDGVWSDTGASLGFVVLPAWYQTWWFRAGLMFALAAAAFAVVRGRIMRLQRQQETQRAFSRGLLESQETERRRIAGELHDSLGQNLVLMKNLALLDNLNATNPAPPNPRATQIAAAADRALEEVHAISYALRPPELDRLGLAKALAGMVRRAAEASGIRFETQIDFAGALPNNSDIQLFRIAQEAVNNLVKHSDAKTARVELWQDEAGVHLIVADDGRGLPGSWHEGSEIGSGLGISSIEERARLIGAQCKWLSQPGKGTTVSVLLQTLRISHR